jgi:hypothetical protein
MKPFTMIHHVDRATLSRMYEAYAPVFVLSTGRCGSKLVAELLNLSPRACALHEPRPTLQYFGHYAYRLRRQPEALAPLVDAARMEMVLQACIEERTYVESNQCLTFFAPALAAVFAGAKFVHLLRHPGDFAASAARKGWYVNDSIWEAGRPRPPEDGSWPSWNLVRKLGWLWNAGNGFLADFHDGAGRGRTHVCRLEDLVASVSAAQELFAFCGLDAPDAARITAMQATKVNPLWIGAAEPPTMRKDPAFPGYGSWSNEMRRDLWEQVGESARRFGYGPEGTRR